MDSKDIMTGEEGEYRGGCFTGNPPTADPARNRILTGEGPVARMPLSNRIVGTLDRDVIHW